MPYWRLSGFYFCYFAALGALVPYWGLYLQSLGFGAAEIGELMAILMATKIVAPNIWGWIADHSGRRMPIVRFASLLSLAIFAGVFWVSDFWWLALVMALFSFFWNASLPQVEAVTLAHLGGTPHHYARTRVWGSVGFIVTVAALGWLLDSEPIGLVPLAVLLLYVGIWLASLTIPDHDGAPHPQDHPSLARVLRRPEVVAFLLVCLLMQASHGAYYAFYSIYLERHGYSGAAIGQLWALGVVAEVLVFLLMHRLLGRFGARRVLRWSLLLAVVRWLLISRFPDSLAIMLAAQTLHAATFGTFHAAAIDLVHRFFVGRHQGRGQALYSSLSFGAGGAAGSFAAGHLWVSAGGGATYLLAAVIAGLAWLIAWFWLGGRRAGRGGGTLSGSAPGT